MYSIRNSTTAPYFKVSIITIMSVFSIFILHFPIYSDFHFANYLKYSSFITTGSIDFLNAGVGGSQVISVFISLICNIDTSWISLYPIILVPFIFLTVALLKEYYSPKLLLLLLLPFALAINYLQTFSLGIHENGFVLFLSVAVLSFLTLKKPASRTLLFLITLIGLSVNFISYKMTFLIILFIIIFQLVQYILNKKPISAPFIISAIIISIISGYFNGFVYSSAIPFTEAALGTLDTGLSKVIVDIDTTLAGRFLYEIPMSVKIFSMLRSVSLIVATLIVLYIIARKLLSREPAVPTEIIFVSYFSAAIGIFIIYNVLGLFEQTYIVYSMLLVPGLIIHRGQTASPILKKGTYLLLGISVLSLMIFSSTYLNDAYLGHDEKASTGALDTVSQWLISVSANRPITSDVFTDGYIKYSKAKQDDFRAIDNLYLYQIYSNGDIDNLISQQPIGKGLFVVNKGLKYFTIMNWYNFKSWNSFNPYLQGNENISLVYDNGSNDVYLGTANKLS